jgi:hypothetical protein
MEWVAEELNRNLRENRVAGKEGEADRRRQESSPGRN